MCTSPNSLQNGGLEIEKKGNDNAFTLINYLPQMLKERFGGFFSGSNCYGFRCWILSKNMFLVFVKQFSDFKSLWY